MAALLLVGAACTPRDTAENACLGGSRPIITTPPVNVDRWPSSSLLIPNGTAIDARSSTFEDSTWDSAGYEVALKFHEVAGTRENVCFVGGVVFSDFDPENTTFDEWHRHYGLIVLQPGFELVGTSFRNQGDLVVFGANATDWKITGVKADGDGVLAHGYIHDDCIENDAMNSGTVVDSKFDGCNIFMSSLGTAVDGSANTVEVSRTLVRLRPFHESFNPAKYGYDQTGGFFKWATPGPGGTPPQLVVRDSIFRADQRAYYGGNSNGFLGLPPGTVCDNVTLVGTAAWPAADLASWTSQCTNLTIGTSADWDAAVADWDADHPAM